jgi:hypothetical protein
MIPVYSVAANEGAINIRTVTESCEVSHYGGLIFTTWVNFAKISINIYRFRVGSSAEIMNSRFIMIIFT